MADITIWHDWKVTQMLGQGSFGKVYQIEREAFGHTYRSALKVIKIPRDQQELDSIISIGMTEEEAKEYFRGVTETISREFALMSELRGNSNIVSFEDFEVIEKDEEPGYVVYIRMELLKPLLKYMREKKMTRDDVLVLGIDMLKALELCEQKNIIHRDVKPENIFVSDRGSFKLGDFGIARQMEHTSGMSKKGTISYMAPEIYKGDPYGSTVDIYSIGIMLYRLMNNNRLPFLPPYPEQIKYSDTEKANLLRMTGAELPMPCNADEELGSIILRACRYEPKERYSSASQMRADLERYRSGGSIGAPAEIAATAPAENASSFDASAATVTPEMLEPTVSQSSAETFVGNTPTETPDWTDPSLTQQENVLEPPTPGQLSSEQPAPEKKAPVQPAPEKTSPERPAPDHPQPLSPGRPPKAKKSRKAKFIAIAAAVAVAVLILIVVMHSHVGEVTIAGDSYAKNHSTIIIYDDTLTVEDVQQLDKLPDLEKVYFRECNLSNEVMEALGEVKTGITRLSFSECSGFSDISPLSNLPYLSILNICNSGLTDDMLAGLDFASMKTLAALRISHNPDVTTLDPVKPAIPHLKGLAFSSTAIDDISILKDAKKLKILLAADCGIKDISGLKACGDMQYINFERNNISDISSMQNMPKLDTLKISDNDVRDLTPLSGLGKLATVSINGNHVSDLSPLAGCAKLTLLEICGNDVTTVEGLSGHSSLIGFYANDNSITSLKGLDDELELEVLSAARNQLTDMTGSENFTQLENVNLEGNDIHDISVLAKSRENMEWVDINGNHVGDLDDLEGMTKLTGVYCDDTGIKTLDPIKDCAELQSVSAADNSLTSLAPLSKKPKLASIDVSGNSIEDMSPVAAPSKTLSGSLIFDLQNNKVETLAFPAPSGDVFSGIRIAVSNNPISNADTTKGNGSKFKFLGIDYYDDLIKQEWTQTLDAGTDIYIADCPKDKQVPLKEVLDNAVLEECIVFTDSDEIDAYMESQLIEVKQGNNTVSIDNSYGDNRSEEETDDADAEESEINSAM